MTFSEILALKDDDLNAAVAKHVMGCVVGGGVLPRCLCKYEPHSLVTDGFLKRYGWSIDFAFEVQERIEEIGRQDVYAQALLYLSCLRNEPSRAPGFTDKHVWAVANASAEIRCRAALLSVLGLQEASR